MPRDATAPVEFRFGRMRSLLAGPPVRTVTVDGTRAEFVTDPVLVRQILVKDGRNYGKGELFQKARNLSRAGLLAADESVHRHYRRLAHPYLRTAAVAGYAPLMRRIARETVTAWRPGQAVDVQAEMCRLAGAIALGTLLGPLSPERSALLGRSLAALTWEMIRKPLHGKAAARARRQGAAQRLTRAREEFRALIASYVAEQHNSPDLAAGYLPALLADPGRAGCPALTADEVCDEAVMMLTAATATTASVMSWALYVLAEEPLIEERVLKGLAREGDEDAGPPRIGYPLRFLMEVLRLYPPVWITCRKTLSDATLGDHALPAGTHVLFSSYLLHRDPERHPDPLRFDPDRWLTTRPSAQDASYIPFGTGAKGCVGESFAWRELEILLGTIMTEWQLALPPGSRVRTAPDTTLHPRRLVMVPQPR